jgi:hypothetical protein
MKIKNISISKSITSIIMNLYFIFEDLNYSFSLLTEFEPDIIVGQSIEGAILSFSKIIFLVKDYLDKYKVLMKYISKKLYFKTEKMI